MSIFPQMAAMLLKEHKHRPIEGDVLLIGRQTVNLTVENALALIRSEGIIPREGFQVEIDDSTIGSDMGTYITDRCFFSMFSAANVIALDVSDYEDAEIVHDLNVELTEKHYAIADFIFNGSCLDNLFDPATAIKSISKMLRPRGRVVHLEHGSPIQSAFLCYSPEWFFDYYAINHYVDCQIYLCSFGQSLQNSWIANRWLPFEETAGGLKPTPLNINVGDTVNIVIAEKGPSSTDSKTPIQCHYRYFQNDTTQDLYVQQHLAFLKSSRRYSFQKELDPAPVIPDPESEIITIELPSPDYKLKELLREIFRKIYVRICKELGIPVAIPSQLPATRQQVHQAVNKVKIPTAATLSSFCGVLRR